MDSRSAHARISAALQQAGRDRGWRDVNPYVTRYLAEHARLGGALDRLMVDSGALDNLDQDRLAGELQAGFLGSGHADPVVQQILRGRQGLRLVGPEDRPSVRALAGLLNGQPPQPARGAPGWHARWVRSRASAPHLVLTGHTEVVETVAFGRLPGDRLVLVSADDDGAIRLWDPLTGAALGEPLAGYGQTISRGEPFPGAYHQTIALGRLAGRLLIANRGLTGVVRLWDAGAGTPLGDPLREQYGRQDGFALVPLDGGGLLLATGGSDGSVRLWDVASRAALGTLAPTRVTGSVGRAVTSLAAGRTSDGRPLLAGGDQNGTVRLWDLTRRTRSGQPLGGHRGTVLALAFGALPEGPVLATTALDGTVRLWDADRGIPLEPSIADPGSVWALAFGRLADGRFVLATGGLEGSVRIWDWRTRTVLAELAGHTDRVTSVAFGRLSDGRALLASGGEDRRVRLWDPGALPARMPHSVPFRGRVTSVAIGEHAIGRPLLASADRDGLVRVSDASSGASIDWPPSERGEPVTALALGRLRDGRAMLATGGSPLGGTIMLRDARTGVRVGTPLAYPAGGSGIGGFVLGIAFGQLPDGRFLLAAGCNDTIGLWDPDTGELVDTLITPILVRAVALARTSDDRGFLASADLYGTVTVWEIGDGPPAVAGSFRADPVEAIALGQLPDGRLLLAAAGGGDNAIRLWDPDHGVPAASPLAGHTELVTGLAFGHLPDGTVVLASSGWDGTVRLWDPIAARQLAVIPTLDAANDVALLRERDASLVVAGTDAGVLAFELRSPR